MADEILRERSRLGVPQQAFHLLAERVGLVELALLGHGFTGRLYAVNRTGTPVEGIPAYRSVRELPPPIDLLVVAVPADEVLALVP